MTDVAADPRLRAVAAAQPYPLLFATVSGSHLYGFPSADSDFDLRGVHVLPPERVLGLDHGPFTIQVAEDRPGFELDLVTHDVRKFFELLLRRNGYVLEQLTSPLVVATSPEHAELREIARGCVTRHHHHHYQGFAQTQWALFHKESPPPVKPLLYVYRVLLTGIHLMRTGEVEANLPRLNQEFALPQVDELIARKRAGAEKEPMPAGDLGLHTWEVQHLQTMLVQSAAASQLPEAPTGRAALHDLLVRVRLRGLGGAR
jgi:predicted nucleotidyltransferase